MKLKRVDNTMGNYENRDIYLDTTGLNNNFSNDEVVKKRLYARNGWIISFEYILFDFKNINLQTKDSVDYKSLTENSTNNKIINGLQKIENIFGAFKMQRVYNYVDTGKFRP